MGWIRKRSDKGTYEASYRDPAGRVRSKSFKTKLFRSACERPSRSAGGDIPRMNLTRAVLGIVQSYRRDFCPSYHLSGLIFPGFLRREDHGKRAPGPRVRLRFQGNFELVLHQSRQTTTRLRSAPLPRR